MNKADGRTNLLGTPAKCGPPPGSGDAGLACRKRGTLGKGTPVAQHPGRQAEQEDM